MPHVVLLYYKFVQISEPDFLIKEQKEVGKTLGLTGRVLIGQEGINGTVAGTSEQIEQYKKTMWANHYFSDLIFKESLSEQNPFPKLKVKLREEIISIHDSKVSVSEKAEYISPEDLQKLFESDQEFYVFDVRNNYESLEGTFEHAITPDIANFRELPKVLKEYPELKDKKIVTVCTGGIRCEKASALFKNQGFKEVYQLEGGIVNYIHQFPNQHFEGDCYVFDDRMRLTQDEIATHGKVTQAPQSQVRL